MEVKYADDARDHVEMLRAHERSRDAQGFARLKSIARRRGPFYGDFGGVVSDIDITRRSTAQILQDVGRVRPGDYLASDVKNDAVPEDVRATPAVREPSWHAAGGTKRHQLNTIAGYETKYFEATYALDGEPYAIKCKATRAERDNGEVHGPVLITVYQGAPKDGRAKKRAKTTAGSLPVAAAPAPAPQQLDDDDEPLVAETPAPPPDDHDLLDDDELDEIADGEDQEWKSNASPGTYPVDGIYHTALPAF